MSPFLTNTWTLFQSLWYWAPIGVLLGEAVSRLLPTERIQGALRSHGTRSLFMASAAGSALPLCACGVIPFLVSFLSVGIPLAPVLAFTAASPVMDPADLVLTLAILGWHFAVTTVVAALALGLGTGGLYLFLERRRVFTSELKVRAVPPSEKRRQNRTAQEVLRETLGQLWFVGRYLLLAIVLGATLETIVPKSLISGILGGGRWYGIPAGVGLGLFSYGISSVPFAKVLLQMGAAPGAVMAFYLAGHATSVGLLSTMATLVRWRTLALYVGVTVAVSMVAGLAYQLLT